MRRPDDDIDRALASWRQGHRAVDERFRLVHDELRVLAGHIHRLRPGETLGPLCSCTEFYLRFADRSSPNLLDRDHLVALAARAMRMVIVDYWRRRHSRKRDPQAPPGVNLEDVPAPNRLPVLDILALDEALCSLSELTPVRSGSWRSVSSAG